MKYTQPWQGLKIDVNADISVIIPVYNGELYLKDAIDSVLSQTLPPQELILVDDGSDDATMSIANEYDDRIKYIRKEHSGIGHTMNVGIQCARCRHIAFLDADDLWVKEKLALQMKAFQSHQVDMVFGYMKQFISPDLSEREQSKIKIPSPVMPGYSAGTLLIKKDTFLSVGLFPTEFQFGIFIEWFSRAKDMELSSLMLPNVLTMRRIHRNNMTGSRHVDKSEYAKMIKSVLDRRRSQK